MWGKSMTGELKYITFNTDMGWVGVLASTKGLLGYKPQDDAFKKFETGLRYIERWEEESKP